MWYRRIVVLALALPIVMTGFVLQPAVAADSQPPGSSGGRTRGSCARSATSLVCRVGMQPSNPLARVGR